MIFVLIIFYAVALELQYFLIDNEALYMLRFTIHEQYKRNDEESRLWEVLQRDSGS